MRRHVHGLAPRAVASLAVILITTSIVAVATPSTARADGGDAAYTSSAVTVKWSGGNDPAIQQYQPDHAALTSDGKGNDAGSGHWDDFKNLEVTVSKTKELGDEAVVITARGMAQTIDTRLNFLQAFQCWGPDPSAPDFNQTCAYGAYAQEAQPLLAPSSYQGVIENISATQTLLSRYDGGVSDAAVPFRAVNGAKSVPEKIKIGQGDSNYVVANGVAHFFARQNTNELPFIPIDAHGQAREPFTAQSAPTQPYLGCGDRARSSTGRCWLVIVPRGTHSNVPAGAPWAPCNIFYSGTGNVYGGAANSQMGSPIATSCTAWQDRIVVPLDFADPYRTCPASVAERRVVGSQLLVEAFSSWQGNLCGGAGADNLALTTNAPDLTRAQLLTGQVGMAAVVSPVTAATIGSADPSLLGAADLAYAPLANTALTIGFLMEDGKSGVGGIPTDAKRGTVRIDVRLTPRLVAKLLTQSYLTDLPQVSGHSEWGNSGFSLDAMTKAKNPSWVYQDPEWKALGNPSNVANVASPWVVWGPQADDAISLLWRYVQSDADADAFLRGQPDPWGMIVNPYYLYDPTGNVGTTTDLSNTPLSTFPKLDGSKAPYLPEQLAKTNNQFLDSTSYAPYSDAPLSNAARIAAADTRMTSAFDQNSGINGGAFTPVEKRARLDQSGRFTIGPTGLAAAREYQLSTASLALPLSTKTSTQNVSSARSFVAPTDAAVSATIAATPVDTATGVASVDPKQIPAGGYPLAMTLNGVVNVNALDASARSDYARLFEYAAGGGNVPGLARGQLPEGYVPLTATQVATTRALVERLRQPIPQAAAVPPARAPAQAPPAPAAAPASHAAAQTQLSSSVVTAAATTSAPATGMQGALGIGLVAGLLGAGISGFFLRRRRA